MNVGCGTGPTHLTFPLPESGGEDTSAFVPFTRTPADERYEPRSIDSAAPLSELPRATDFCSLEGSGSLVEAEGRVAVGDQQEGVGLDS